VKETPQRSTPNTQCRENQTDARTHRTPKALHEIRKIRLVGFAAAFEVRTRPRVALARMKILLNGESIEIREAITIAELIERYQFPPQSILVEHNGLAVHRHEWAQRPLSEGDRIEFIRVVAGG